MDAFSGARPPVIPAKGVPRRLGPLVRDNVGALLAVAPDRVAPRLVGPKGHDALKEADGRVTPDGSAPRGGGGAPIKAPPPRREVAGRGVMAPPPGVGRAVHRPGDDQGEEEGEEPLDAPPRRGRGARRTCMAKTGAERGLGPRKQPAPRRKAALLVTKVPRLPDRKNTPECMGTKAPRYLLRRGAVRPRGQHAP